MTRIRLDWPETGLWKRRIGPRSGEDCAVALDSTRDRRGLRAYESSGLLTSHIEAEDDSDACRLVVADVGPWSTRGGILARISHPPGK